MGTVSMGAMQSDLHQQMDCGDADTQDAFHSSSFQQAGCSDMEASGGCCASCVACALPMTLPIHLESVSLTFEVHAFNRPQVDLESELQPPRTRSS